MESPSWFPSFHTKQILDFKMSKCSLKYFMATLLIIRDLESITQEEDPWSCNLRRVSSEHMFKNRRLAEVTSSPALACHLFLPSPLPGSISLGEIRSIVPHTVVLMGKVLYRQHKLKNTMNKEESTGSARRAATRSKQGTIRQWCQIPTLYLQV